MKHSGRLIFAGLLAAAALAAGCGDDDDDSGEATAGSSGSEAQQLEGQKLVWVDYGGEDVGAAHKAAWLDPFSAETGVQFATDSPSDPAKVKAMVDAGRTTWDVIDLEPASGAGQCGTLYEKRSADVDVSAVDPKYMTDDCGVPVKVLAIQLVYNKEMYGDDPPTKITDFLDTERFPGKRIIFNYAFGGLEPLLLADGVAGDELFPLDFDRAEAVIDELGDDLVFHSDMAQQVQAQVSGDFGMCLCYVGRSALAAQNGADIGVVWDSGYILWDAVYAIKGSKYPEAQQAFLNFLATPEAQAALTENLPYGPTTPDAQPDITPEFEEYLPDTHADEVGTPGIYDAQWWLENSDTAFARWTDMTAG
jgi:putative spermidine/putrescine transport system substrate-binding protein